LVYQCKLRNIGASNHPHIHIRILCVLYHTFKCYYKVYIINTTCICGWLEAQICYNYIKIKSTSTGTNNDNSTRCGLNIMSH